MRLRKVVVGMTVSAVALVTADQIALHTVLADGVLFGHELAPFAPPLYSAQQRALLDRYEAQLRDDRAAFDSTTRFDAELGWCPRPGQVTHLARFDWAGARVARGPLPRPVPTEARLVALVGGSFTHGSEVRGDESWAAELERRAPAALFANFGVPGFGAGQTLLRYRRDVAKHAPDEVWFGYLPNAALRPTSHFPALSSRWRARTMNFKPCASLDADGALVVRPSPARTPEDIPRLLRDPAAFLRAVEEGDRWIARARPAYLPLGEHWLHRTALGRVALTAHERGGRDHRALMSDPESDVYRLSRALVLTLADEVEANGARFRLVVLPSATDLQGLETGARAYWQCFLDELAAEGVTILDLTPALLRAGVRAEKSDEHWRPEGHYAPATNRLVADELARAWLAD